MPAHMLPRSTPALFSHVIVDNAPLYRTILDVFAASKRQFRLHLRPDDVLTEAAWPAELPTMETLNAVFARATTAFSPATIAHHNWFCFPPRALSRSGLDVRRVQG
jgi:hypothetical protein